MKLANRTVKSGDTFLRQLSKERYCVVTVHRNASVTYTTERAFLRGSLSPREKVNVPWLTFEDSIFQSWVDVDTLAPKPQKAAKNVSAVAISTTAEEIEQEIRNSDHRKALLDNIVFDIQQQGMNPFTTLMLENYIADVTSEAFEQGKLSQ